MQARFLEWIRIPSAPIGQISTLFFWSRCGHRMLPASYRAQIDERVTLIEEEVPPRIVEPDLTIDRDRRHESNAPSRETGPRATMIAMMTSVQ